MSDELDEFAARLVARLGKRAEDVADFNPIAALVIEIFRDELVKAMQDLRQSPGQDQ